MNATETAAARAAVVRNPTRARSSNAPNHGPAPSPNADSQLTTRRA